MFGYFIDEKFVLTLLLFMVFRNQPLLLEENNKIQMKETQIYEKIKLA